MRAPVYAYLQSDAAATELLEAGALLKVFAGGIAPQGTIPPYVCHQTISGLPENYLSERPDMDAYRT
ncbi:MAG: hypothetical protein ACREUF_13955, partial [Solimonas sp.]